MTDEEWKEFSCEFQKHEIDIKLFMNSVEGYFSEHLSLFKDNESVIHSTKKRMKNISHLREKIDRKIESGRAISPENLLPSITDLAGVRLILLFQNDFKVVDAAMRQKIATNDWSFHEQPKAFTWDPEARKYFSEFDLVVEQRDTFYTSVHYLIKPRVDSQICCEVQVRTLFEEIWGEVDHKINYPNKTDNLACREQLMVLSKIVGAGSRLVDSIQRSLEVADLDGDAPLP